MEDGGAQVGVSLNHCEQHEFCTDARIDIKIERRGHTGLDRSLCTSPDASIEAAKETGLGLDIGPGTDAPRDAKRGKQTGVLQRHDLAVEGFQTAVETDAGIEYEADAHTQAYFLHQFDGAAQFAVVVFGVGAPYVAVAALYVARGLLELGALKVVYRRLHLHLPAAGPIRSHVALADIEDGLGLARHPVVVFQPYFVERGGSAGLACFVFKLQVVPVLEGRGSLAGIAEFGILVGGFGGGGSRERYEEAGHLLLEVEV